MVSNRQRNLDKCIEPLDYSRGSSSQWFDVMKRKRAVHEEIMNLVHPKRSSEQADKHLEVGLSVRGNEGFGSSSCDDDSTGFAKAKSTIIGIRSRQSGSKIKSTKTGIYKWWKERSHHKVSFRGTNSDGGHLEVDRGFSGDRQMRGDNRNYRRGRSEGDRGFSGDCQMRGDNKNYKGGKKHGIPNAHVPSEIRNPDQVRKRRHNKPVKSHT
ncbi:hypothetical protein IFM89_033562 [Coptis chinensis]|uniref:Uncharacterized protein n=1 Tax=Coptis chinensis TaxID=261450 RepID=A0A835LX59_9MAGN|nr:hypothetical protein IFM89_033562 [Coptis chinensis]